MNFFHFSYSDFNLLRGVATSSDFNLFGDAVLQTILFVVAGFDNFRRNRRVLALHLAVDGKTFESCTIPPFLILLIFRQCQIWNLRCWAKDSKPSGSPKSSFACSRPVSPAQPSTE